MEVLVYGEANLSSSVAIRIYTIAKDIQMKLRIVMRPTNRQQPYHISKLNPFLKLKK
jgi:hypothetical protein